jgi:hypothetical protein
VAEVAVLEAAGDELDAAVREKLERYVGARTDTQDVRLTGGLRNL